MTAKQNDQQNEQTNDEQKKPETSRRLLSSNSKKSSSFVSKHFSVQRRKTIHDAGNIDLINNLISNGNNLSESASRLSSTSSGKTTHMDNQNSLPSTSNLLENANRHGLLTPGSCDRELVKQGPVTLINVCVQFMKSMSNYWTSSELVL